MKYLNFENYYISEDSKVHIPKENESDNFSVQQIESFGDIKVISSLRVLSVLLTVLMIVLYFMWKRQRKEKLK